MDLYSPSRIASLTSPKQLQEAAADIGTEIATLEAIENRSSLQEQGLRNLKASAALVMSKLESIGTGIMKGADGRWRSMGGDRLENDPGDRPTDRKRAGLRTDLGERYMTFRTTEGNEVYAVGRGQRFADIPTIEQGGHDRDAMGQIIRAHLIGDKSGLSPSLRNAIDGATSGSYNVPSQLSAMVIDLARAQSVLSQAGMVTIGLESDSLKIARVVTDPTFSQKIENETFQESDIAFGAITITPRMVGCLVRASQEVIDDAPNFPTLITETIAKAWAQSIDNYGLNGTGIRLPNGLFGTLSADIANTDVSAASFAWTSLSAAALEVKNRNHTPSAAIMTPTREHGLQESVDLQERWLGPPPTLANVAMLSSTQVPAAKVAIGDFSQFAVGVRTQMRLDFTDVGAGAFEKNQRVFRVYWRGDFTLLDERALQIITLT